MTEVSVRDFKARLSHYLDLMSQGEVFTVRGLDVGCVTTPVTTGEKVDHLVTTLSDKDVDRIAEKLKLKLKEDVRQSENICQTNVRQSSFNKKEAFNNLKEALGVDSFGQSKPVEYLEVDAYSLGDTSVSYKEKWVKVKKVDLPKGFSLNNTRPVQEETDLPMYDLGLTPNRRAAIMNDGSNPIPKPVKKKK